MDINTYIAGVAMSMAQSSTAQSVSTAMLSKTLDSIESQGAQIVDMISQLPPAGAKGHLLNILV